LKKWEWRRGDGMRLDSIWMAFSREEKEEEDLLWFRGAKCI
jgi:hypothetical protein